MVNESGSDRLDSLESPSADDASREPVREAPPTPLWAPAGILLGVLTSSIWIHRAMFGPTFRTSERGWLEDLFFATDTTMPVLHLVLFTGIAFHRRAALFESLGTPGRPVIGVLVGTAGAATLTWSTFTQQPDIALDALVLSIIGSSLILGGTRLLERLTLPLAVLWLSRPLPPAFSHHLHDALQQLTARFAEVTIGAFSELHRSGLQLAYQEKIFEVIEGCSGLGLMLSLLLAMLTYCAFTSTSRRQTFGVIALAIVISPVMNGVRVIWIMLNPSSEIAGIHSTQGLVVISLTVVTLAIADTLLQRRFWPAPAIKEGKDQTAAPRAFFPARIDGARRIAPVAITTLLALCATLYPYERPTQLTLKTWRLFEFAPQLGDWKRIHDEEFRRNYWGSVEFSQKRSLIYERGDARERVRLLAVTDDPRRRDQSGLTPKTQRLGAAWEILESLPIEIESLGIQATRTIQRRFSERALVLHFRIGAATIPVEILRWLTAVDLRPDITPTEILTVRLSVPIDERNPTRALVQLSSFQTEVEQAILKAAPR